MACKKCHRQGLCTECCCISSDHTSRLPNLFECRGCQHPLPIVRSADGTPRWGLPK